MTVKEEEYYKRIKSSFIGQKVKEVYYEVLDFENEVELWKISDEIHSIDMNLIFRLENNQLLQVKWDNEFYCYGVGFEKLSKINQREGIKVINVSGSLNRNKIIGKKISEINVFWDISEGLILTYSRNKVVEKEKSIKRLPQTWELNFENNVIWVSTLEVEEENKAISFWADHLSIIFTYEEQKKYKLVEKSSMQYCVKNL